MLPLPPKEADSCLGDYKGMTYHYRAAQLNNRWKHHDILLFRFSGNAAYCSCYYRHHYCYGQMPPLLPSQFDLTSAKGGTLL